LLAGDGAPDAEYCIVSKDKGFASIRQFWQSRRPGAVIRLQRMIRPDGQPQNAGQQKPAEPQNAGQTKQPEAQNEAQQKPVGAQNGPQQKPAQQKNAQKPADAQNTAKPEANAADPARARIAAVLQKGGIDESVADSVWSLAQSLRGAPAPLRDIYQGIVKKYGQKKGLTIYNQVKSELKQLV
ncbi:MAG: hypothetical protein J6V48_08515, partial [Clostridia bacterium]|nr:hypothetical protein [Clostridia bacterium]